MTRPTLHVLTRGRAPEHDYAWVVVEPAESPHRPERPPRLDARAAQLVQSDHPSLLLLRADAELVLFATALESSRRDVQGRPIRNALALVLGEEAQDVLRGLAARALRDGARAALEDLVDARVKDAPDGGVWVEPELLADLLGLEPAPAAEHFDPTRRFGPNEAPDREALADEVERSVLPPGQGPLLIVTGALAAERLEASGVWRGLSRLVFEPVIEPPPEVRPPRKKGRAGRALAWRRRAPIGLGIIAMILTVVSFLLGPPGVSGDSVASWKSSLDLSTSPRSADSSPPSARAPARR